MDQIKEKKKLGRPRLPEDQKQKYQRVAISPSTYIVAKELSTAKGDDLIVVLDNAVKFYHNYCVSSGEEHDTIS